MYFVSWEPYNMHAQYYLTCMQILYNYVLNLYNVYYSVI